MQEAKGSPERSWARGLGTIVLVAVVLVGGIGAAGSFTFDPCNCRPYKIPVDPNAPPPPTGEQLQQPPKETPATEAKPRVNERDLPPLPKDLLPAR